MVVGRGTERVAKLVMVSRTRLTSVTVLYSVEVS
jgi:hypothetical protein